MAAKKLDKKNRRKEIARIALEIFARKGFIETSVSDVARESGIAKGTMYEYFKSKEELIHTALSEWIDEYLFKMSREFINIVDPVERLRHLAEISVKDVKMMELESTLSLGMIQLLLREESYGPQKKVVLELMEKMHRRGFEYIAEIIKDGVRKGVFKPEVEKEAMTIAINLNSFLTGLVLNHIFFHAESDYEKQVKLYFDYILDNLCMDESKYKT